MRTFFGSVFFFICLLAASLWVEGLGNEFRGAVITSFIVSWAIGLAPPLLIRFGMAKKPLSVAASLGISVLFIFVNLVISTALGRHGGPALYFIAVASYQILRKEGKCDGAVVPVAVTPAVTASKPAVVAGRMEPPPLQKKEKAPIMNDDAFYDEVAKELEANKLIPGVWTRAFAEADGDENRAKAIYIKLRVAQLAEEAKRMTMLAFADTRAVSWEMVNDRWVRNTYANGDVTMSDKETGKMWLCNANPCGEKTWADAVAYCSNLTYAGYSDWRLPDKDTLEAQFSQKGCSVGVQSSGYWSGTSGAYSTDVAWVVGMYYGRVYSHYKTNYYYVWPVRDGQ
jgi:hypothetical protein